MFERKRSDRNEDDPDRQGGEERGAPDAIVEAARRVDPGKITAYHPDVPLTAPEPVGGPHIGEAIYRPDVPRSAPDAPISDAARRPGGDSKRLVVGRDTALNGGVVVDCDHLIVEGQVEAAMPGGSLLDIVKGGSFQGAATVGNADISGSFEGELRVKKKLLIRSTGCVSGTILYGELEVERSGRLEGQAGHDLAACEAGLEPLAAPDAEDAQTASQEDVAQGRGHSTESPPGFFAEQRLKAGTN